MEASLLAVYRRDAIGEWWRGEITLRQLKVMVEHLPDGSAAVVAARGHGWGAAEFALASLNDVAAQLLEVTRAVNTKDGAFTPPEPYPRPGLAAKEADQEQGSGRKQLSAREQQDDISFFESRQKG